MVKLDATLARFVINYYIDMVDLLRRNGFQAHYTGNMFCPFHPNTNTPASKMYKDEYSSCLYCFNEKRLYYSWDVYTILLKMDAYKLAENIWNKMSEETQNAMVNLSGSQQDYEGDIPFLDSLVKFSEHKISYEELCNDIALIY